MGMDSVLYSMFENWSLLAAMALILATGLVSLVYMFGSLLMNETMKTWAKMELVEIFYSAVLIIIAVPALVMIDGVVQGALGVTSTGVGGQGLTYVYLKDYSKAGISTIPTTLVDLCNPNQIGLHQLSVYHNIPACHMRLGIYYLRVIFDETKDLAFNIYLSYIKTSVLADATITLELVFEMAGMISLNPWKGFYAMGNIVKAQVFDYMVKLMVITKFQEVLLVFISTAVFPSLFVLGVLLRSFTFTRKLGGLLIAMALTLYFIFPMFYAFGGLLTIHIKNNARDAGFCGVNKLCDPPLSNNMYVGGTYALPDNSTFNLTQAKLDLQQIEGLTDAELSELMEKGQLSPLGGGPTIHAVPGFNMASSSLTDADKKKAYDESQKKVEGWFGKVAMEESWDYFIANPTSKSRTTAYLDDSPAYGTGGVIDIVARLTFYSLFFSLFGILACIAVIRSISVTLGGDIEIAGLTRLI
ncbi:MAG: hypothetical protein ABID61_02580 [Candidatus Micrarchaeota archaeon]